MTTSLVEIQLQGIRCTNCAQKIKTNLHLLDGVKTVNVNVLQEKVLIEFSENNDALDKITSQLMELSFQILAPPTKYSIEDSNSEKRKVSFLIPSQQDTTQLEDNLKQKLGFISLETTDFDQKSQLLVQLQQQTKNHLNGELQIIQIEYNFRLLKARDIFDIISDLQIANDIYTPFLDNFKTVEKKDVSTAIALTLAISFLTMVLPQIDSISVFMVLPQQYEFISFYLVLLIVLSLITIWQFGIRTFRNAYNNFQEYGQMNMETLITIGTLSAFSMFLFQMAYFLFLESNDSNQATQRNLHEDMGDQSLSQTEKKKLKIMHVSHILESASIILCVVTFGKYLEGKAKKSITDMTKTIFPENELLSNMELRHLEPKNRNFVIENERDLNVVLFDKDDLLRVDAGMRLLLDGIIVHVDTPIQIIDTVCYGSEEEILAKKGDRIQSGAMILEGRGIIQVENVIENSMLVQISQQLNLSKIQSENQESGLHALNKKMAEQFVQIILLVSLISFLVWTFLLFFEISAVNQQCVWCFPIERAISVLVASCPCSLGLAIPCVLVTTINISMKHGLLIQKNKVFQAIKTVKAVVFDKTGTLFTQVNEINEYSFYQTDSLSEENQLWQIISIVEKGCHHPIAELLYKESINRIGTTVFNTSFVPLNKTQFEANGVIGSLKRQSDSTEFLAKIGNESLMQEGSSNEIPADLLQEINKSKQSGQTVIMVSINDKIQMVIHLENRHNLRLESHAVVQYLQTELQKQVFILSGDAQPTVDKIGEELDIPKSNLFGDINQHGKKNFLQKLRQERNIQTLMVGDGLNDILSLEEASIGVSINAQSVLNLMACDVVALSENLWKIPILFKLMEKAHQFIVINLLWSFLYNIIMIPISAGVFYYQNIIISPSISSVAMSLSSLIVVIFSNFLKCVNFEPKIKSQKKIQEKSQSIQMSQMTQKQEIQKYVNFMPESYNNA